jgi:hypothetical protein
VEVEAAGGAGGAHDSRGSRVGHRGRLTCI